MWDLLWTKWCWERFFSQYFGFPLSVTLHQCSVLIFGLVLLSPDDNRSKPENVEPKQCLLRYRSALVWNCSHVCPQGVTVITKLWYHWVNCIKRLFLWCILNRTADSCNMKIQVFCHISAVSTLHQALGTNNFLLFQHKELFTYKIQGQAGRFAWNVWSWRGRHYTSPKRR